MTATLKEFVEALEGLRLLLHKLPDNPKNKIYLETEKTYINVLNKINSYTIASNETKA